ncbi:MAG: B12-binding domain-containing radical SAM protein [Lachnospiraceae bacterium]|nr:B12-binding domain-containing radical SAM protein [Lachnospiraceae bacterium]
MKFLLAAINAKYIHSNPAVYSLKAYAESRLRNSMPDRIQKDAPDRIGSMHGIQIEIAEYTINHRPEQIWADLYKRKPDVIGISCYIWNMDMVERVVAEVHKLLPQVPLWLGGPEVSYEPQTVLARLPFLSGIMVGEGEETFFRLLEHYDSRENGLLEIPGLYLPTGYTGLGQVVSMDELPFLYRDLSGFENRIVYYESSRGCPFRCSYCLSSIDKRVRFRSLETVYGELQFFLDRRVPQVKFIDRTFNCSHEHAMGIWNYIKEHDNGVTNFHFEIAADLLREDELELLAGFRPGLAQLEIGVQTTNEETLRAINRHMDLEKLRRIVTELKKGHNIHLHLDLIAGLPYEDYESFAHSFDEVYAMEPEQLQLGFLKVLKGSQMYEEAEKYGICYTERPPYEVLYTKFLTYEQVLKLKQIEEMVELYYNSNQFRHILPVLQRAFPSPFRMFERLAEFYEEEGYFVMAPARAYRYQVLLDFAFRYDDVHRELYRELCLFDMYLRENLKSRPDFAPDLQTCYDTIRDFYRSEEEKPTVLSQYEGMSAKQMMKQTHMEPFYYPVWKPESCPDAQRAEQPYFVVFDYKVRNPLTYDAAYYRISEEMEE